MPAQPADPSRLRVAGLNRRAKLAVDLRPDAEARAAIARDFGLLDLAALALTGTLEPASGESWRFEGRMQANVVQPCVVSLEPVPAQLDEPVVRVWSPNVTVAEGGGEVEMGDDSIEPLGQIIDLGAVLTEELSLALPPYPRAAGLAPAPDEDAASQDEAERRRPFADLDKLLGGGKTSH